MENCYLVRAVRHGRLGWYVTTSRVRLFAAFFSGGLRPEVFDPFDLLLYGGFIIATAGEVFHNSMVLVLKASSGEQICLIRRAWLVWH